MTKKAIVQTGWEGVKKKIRTVKKAPAGYRTVTELAQAQNVTPAAIRKMLTRGAIHIDFARKVRHGMDYRVFIAPDALKRTKEKRGHQDYPVPVEQINDIETAKLELKRIQIEQERYALCVAKNAQIEISDVTSISRAIAAAFKSQLRILRNNLAQQIVDAGLSHRSLDDIGAIIDGCLEEIIESIAPLERAETYTGEPIDG